VRLAGLAEMNVDVDEAGRDDEAFGVDDAGLFLLRPGEGRDDFAVDREDVADGIALGSGIDDAAVFFSQEVGAGSYSTGATCSGWPPAQR
jgi:hypothetical protein